MKPVRGGTEAGPSSYSRRFQGQSEDTSVGPEDDDDADHYAYAEARRLRSRRRRWAGREADEYDRLTHTVPDGRHPLSRRVIAPTPTKSIPLGPLTTSGIRPRPIWSRLRNYALILAGILLLEGAVSLLTAPVFSISEVQFSGEQHLSPVVLSQARDRLLGQNWVRARWTGAQLILKNVPSVSSATFSRLLSWPPKVRVDVVERQPFARVGGGKVWSVVDSDGVPFRRATKADQNLYAVTGPNFDLDFGRPIDAKRWQPVVEFAAAMQGAHQSGEVWNLRRVYFDREGNASLRVSGGDSNETLVRLGSEGWERKLATARQTLADFSRQSRHAATLNLISSTVATWIPRDLAKPLPKQHTTPAPTAEQAQRAAR